VAATYAFDDIGAAFEQLAVGRNVGKVAVTVSLAS
jgi:hypothetical protein